jgi:hypothetical protein
MSSPVRAAALCATLAVTISPAAASARTDGSTPISPGVYDAVTTVPVATLDAVGAKNVAGPLQFGVAKLNDGAITRNGKPVFLSANLAWCPHCAANSWAIVVALERFGDFAKLRVLDTGTYFANHGGHPGFSHTKGISFLNNGYTSPYLEFDAVIVEDLKGRKFQKLTTAQKAALKFTDGGYPATNIGGLYGTVGSGYGPESLRGAKLTPQKIANALHNPSSPIAKRVDGLANFFSAAICRATGNMPEDVCSSPGVQAGATKLPTS